MLRRMLNVVILGVISPQVEVVVSGKHSSLQFCRINYSCENFMIQALLNNKQEKVNLD